MLIFHLTKVSLFVYYDLNDYSHLVVDPAFILSCACRVKPAGLCMQLHVLGYGVL
jgi:hypothetical protein